MFIIPCKYNPKYRLIQQVVSDIRKFHPEEKICVVDSDSQDKSYFEDIKKYKNVFIEDVANKHFQIGAIWIAYKKYPDEDFYYIIHDSMRIKANLDYLKEKELTIFMHFPRMTNITFDMFSEKINKETKYTYKFGKIKDGIQSLPANPCNSCNYTENCFYEGLGVQGPIFFCKNIVLRRMVDMGADKILPVTKQEAGYCEGCFGFFFEEQGFDLIKCSMYGGVFEFRNQYNDMNTCENSESASQRFFPVEKLVMGLYDETRR